MSHSSSSSANRPRHVQRRMRRIALEKAESPDAHCSWCGKGFDLSLEGDHPRAVSAEHVIPRCKGGPDEPGNIEPMHRECNAAKGRLEDWLQRTKGDRV